MKILLLILTLSILSCGGKEDKTLIETHILIHNSKVRQDFVRDSLQEDTRIRMDLMNKNIPESLITDKLNAHGPVFKNNWNDPYEITKDFNLTYNKYMDFCKANKKDPETFHKFLRK